MATEIVKIIGIICMLTFIVVVVALCFIPDSRLIKFLSKYERVQFVVSIAFYMGLILAFYAVL